MDEQTKFVFQNDITEYNDRELSQHFLNIEPLHIRMITEDVLTLRQIAEDSFIFTEAQWNDLLATRKEWIDDNYQYHLEIQRIKAIDDCPYDEPLHNHHDGCPSCRNLTEEEF